MNESQRAMALEQHRREHLRWQIILVLYTGRPYPLGEDLILRTLGDADAQTGLQELRREVSYLEGCELVRINGQARGAWMTSLTAHGIEVAEYQRDAPPGIHRPVW